MSARTPQNDEPEGQQPETVGNITLHALKFSIGIVALFVSAILIYWAPTSKLKVIPILAFFTGGLGGLFAFLFSWMYAWHLVRLAKSLPLKARVLGAFGLLFPSMPFGIWGVHLLNQLLGAEYPADADFVSLLDFADQGLLSLFIIASVTFCLFLLGSILFAIPRAGKWLDSLMPASALKVATPSDATRERAQVESYRRSREQLVRALAGEKVVKGPHKLVYGVVFYRQSLPTPEEMEFIYGELDRQTGVMPTLETVHVQGPWPTSPDTFVTTSVLYGCKGHRVKQVGDLVFNGGDQIAVAYTFVVPANS